MQADPTVLSSPPRSPIGTPVVVDGQPVITVAELLREGPLSPSQAALIGFEAARLVDNAWREGRVTRVDPQSVAVDAEARVLLVARSASTRPREGWSPPEAHAGARGMVWALGRLLAEMLVPGHTRRGDETPVTGVAARCQRLASISERATSPDPGARQQSVRQLAREIGAYLLDAAPELA